MASNKNQLELVNSTEKHDVTHVENLGLGDEALGVTVDGNGLLKSRFDELSIPRTLWVFRRVVLVTLAVYTGYMCEGFEVSPSCLGRADEVARSRRQYHRQCGIHQRVWNRWWWRRRRRRCS